MVERTRKFDIRSLGRDAYRSSARPAAATAAQPGALPTAATELLRSFKSRPGKPLLVSEIAAAADRSSESCANPIIALVKAGSLDLLERADGGNHLVGLTAAGRAQLDSL